MVGQGEEGRWESPTMESTSGFGPRVAALLKASQAGDGLTRALKYLEMLEGDRGSNREDGRRVPCDAA
jgi:hypothetical protein